MKPPKTEVTAASGLATAIAMAVMTFAGFAVIGAAFHIGWRIVS